MDEDLCQLIGPITDASILKILKQRYFDRKYHTFMGTSLVVINPQTHRLPHKALTCSRGLSEELRLLVSNILIEVEEKKQSHVILISGENGSGKTRTSMELLRHLYDLAAGGSATDVFKLMSAALTALRPFDTTANAANYESSRSCWSVECSVSKRAVTSAQITLHSLSTTRLSYRPEDERSYDIFYMMLSGMSHEELEQCYLPGHSIDTITYLQNTHRKSINHKKYREKYLYWKDALAMIGINHMEILKLLSAVLLLGNFSFRAGNNSGLDIEGSADLAAAASLLGLSEVVLYRCLTTKTMKSQRRTHQVTNTADYANNLRHILAQSLYSRLLQHLTGKINQTMEAKSPTSCSKTNQKCTSWTMSPDSNSVHIVDCLAFQNNQGTQLEQLCGNICAEAIQHFYNMATFHELLDSFDEEGIALHSDIRWRDNSSTIQLLTEQNIGLISLLHKESTESHSSSRSLTKKLEKLHTHSDSLKLNRTQSCFTIQHYGCKVTYDCESLLHENKNNIPDDIVSMFSKSSTSSSLLSRLYATEIHDMAEKGGQPCGVEYRCNPCQYNTEETKAGSHGEDFLTNIDKLMQTLASCNTSFIRCIKASPNTTANHWDDDFVKRQMVMLELTESLKVVTGGLPHRISYKEFVSRYQCLTCHKSKPISSSDYQQTSQDIMSQYLRIMEAKSIPYLSANWVFGRKHIFLSDEASRQLDMVKCRIRYEAACKIQSVYRGYVIRKHWPSIASHLNKKHRSHSKRYTNHAYDSGYNTPQSQRAASSSMVNLQLEHNHNLLNHNTDHVFHWKPTFKNMQDMDAPPLPEKRKYSVQGGLKVYFPQIRVMRESANVEGYELGVGQEVLCIGYSALPAHISIAYQNDILDVPYEKTSIKVLQAGQQRPTTKCSDKLSLSYHRTAPDLLASEL